MRIPKAEDKQKVLEAMQRVNIEHLAERQIGELSGGQKKRVFLARALAQQSKIILLDEPFTGVDVKTENAIVELLRQLRAEGHLILVSTHNLGSVPDFCDQVVMINRTVIAAGKTEDTFNQHNLEKVFGGVLRHSNYWVKICIMMKINVQSPCLPMMNAQLSSMAKPKMIRLQRL